MQQPVPAALVTTSPFNRAVLVKLPALLDHLGPIKAPSMRMAARVANALRRGHAARHWHELEDCGLLVVAASSEKLDGLLLEMRESPVQWKGRLIALVCAERDSRALRPLADLGAKVASFHLIGDPMDPTFWLEGEPAAVRELRRLLLAVGAKPFVTRKGAVDLPRLAEKQLRLVLPPLFDSAVAALRQSGLNRIQARRVLEIFAVHSLRSFQKSGRRSWRKPDSLKARQILDRQLEQLGESHPEAAQFCREAIASAVKRFSRPGSLPAAAV